MERYFGWLPQPKDKRDFKFKLPNISPLPTVNLDMYMPKPAFNQLALNSCTVHGTLRAYMMEMIKRNRDIFMPSRLGLWFMTREYEGSAKKNEGCYLRDVMKMANKYGVFPESEWEYIISKFAERPPAHCYKEAEDHQLLKYYSVRTPLEVKTAITLGHAVIYGFPVYTNFMDIKADGMMPEPKGVIEGYHAVCTDGYNNDVPMSQYITIPKGRCQVWNSWGEEWGDRGKFYAPYENMSSWADCWVIDLIE